MGIAIIILNYNNAKDTIECLKSILPQIVSNVKVIVVDNGSTDGSFEKIFHYLNYQREILSNQLNILNRVIVLKSNVNRGYAAGNNIGIKYASSDPTINLYWLVNNDTILAENAISNLLLQSEYIRTNNLIGIYGTLLIRYYHREIIQAIGGKYFPIIGKAKLVLPDEPLNTLVSKDIKLVASSCDYLIGASLILTKSCIDKVGLLSEKYFLYFEELDYFKRARKKNINFSILKDVIVYHKEGGTTGAEYTKQKQRDVFIEFHNCRSRIIYTLKYYPLYIPIVFAAIVFHLVMLYRKNLRKAFVIIRKLIKELGYHK